ncbi:NADPH-dependent F420 reductase [Micromonospora sp. NPDC126480]|uniref:NADPH-dependent F420 reductase n=1 Tax=Micromonospora sp. NPDC126480 TaxID=3155312 RepID=UPI0033224934
MTHVTIIGTGNMGTAIAGVVTAGGNTVDLLGHAEINQPAAGQIVVLAVPYPAVTEVIAAQRDSLARKVVVDITNPLDFDTFDSLVVPPDGSAAAEIAAALPQSQVVKAFNTTFAATLNGRKVGSQPTTVLMAGDDADAKTLLGGVVEAGGLRAVDVGPLRRARELEAIGFLQIGLAAAEKVPWDGGFAVVS